MLVSGIWIPFGVIWIVSTICGYLFDKFSGRYLVQKNKTSVVITGCSSGIGKSAAIHFAKKGVVVFASVRKNEDAENLKKESKNIIPIIMDVTDSQQITKAVEQVKNNLETGGLQLVALINNAGASFYDFIELQEIQKYRKAFDLNTFGQIEVTQGFLPLLRQYKSTEREGRIIFISSMSALFPFQGISSYSASKRAIEAVAECLRQELGPFGIKTILVCPGATRTEIMSVLHNPEITFKESMEIKERANPNGVVKPSKLDSVVFKEYEKKYNLLSKSIKDFEKFAETTQSTDLVLEKAVFSFYPRARYLIGKDTQVFYHLSLLPETLIDFVSRLLSLE